MNPTSFAWATGLFEGEGCLGIYRRSNGRGYRINVQVSLTDEDVLRRFVDVIGIGNIRGPYVRSGRKPAWRWSVDGFERVQYVVAVMWPWLGARRRARAREILLAYRYRTTGRSEKDLARLFPGADEELVRALESFRPADAEVISLR